MLNQSFFKNNNNQFNGLLSKTSSPQKTVPLMPRCSLPEYVKDKDEMGPAELGTPEKWLLNRSSSSSNSYPE